MQTQIMKQTQIRKPIPIKQSVRKHIPIKKSKQKQNNSLLNQANLYNSRIYSNVNALKDVSTNTNQGIILFNDAEIQHILNKSGIHAKTQEYQVHYWSLIFRHKAADNSILDICIPTVFFNYKQQVSTATIDFELLDVDNTSDSVLPIHNLKVNEIMKSNFKENLEQLFNVNFTPISVAINSLHCHPGTNINQNFSQTDLNKKIEQLGIVFPLDTVENDRPNFAGIMVRKTANNNVIAHFEYRTANGKLKENLVYTQGRCAALISKPTSTISTIETMFNITPKSNNYSVLKKCTQSQIFDKIQNYFNDIKFEAFTDTIISENVTLKHNVWNQKVGNSFYNDEWNEYPYLKQITQQPKEFKQTIPSATKSINEPITETILQKEYKEAKETLNKYKDFNIIDVLDLDKQELPFILQTYQKLHQLYYNKIDYFLEETPIKDLDETLNDFIFEIMVIQDDIESDIIEAKNSISIYEKQLKEKNKQLTDQQMIDDFTQKNKSKTKNPEKDISRMTIINILTNARHNKNQLLFKTDEELDTLYTLYKEETLCPKK